VHQVGYYQEFLTRCTVNKIWNHLEFLESELSGRHNLPQHL